MGVRISLLFRGNFLSKGSRFGGALRNYGFHVAVTFHGICTTSALIGFFYFFLRLYRIFDNLPETTAYNQDYELLTTNNTSKTISYPFRITFNFRISPFFLFFSTKSEANGRSSRIQGRLPELLGRHMAQDRLPSSLALICWLFLPGTESGEHSAKILSSKVQRAECFDGFQWVLLRSTKLTHLCRFVTHSGRSPPKN